MRRPFLWSAAGMTAGIYLCLYKGNPFLVMPVLIVLGLFLFRIRKTCPFFILIGLFLGFFTCFCYSQSRKPLILSEGSAIAFTGIVKENKEYGFLMRIDRYDNGTGSYSVNPFYSFYVTVSSDQTYEEYTRVTIEGTAESYAGPDNPGQFDASSYYPSIGSLYNVSATTVTSVKEPGILRHVISSFRTSVKERITVLFPGDSSGLPSALLLGDKRQMGDGSRDLYERFGLAHILTVSGLHIGLLSNLLSVFFLYFFERKTSDRIVLVFLLFYGLLCGFRISCIRAVFTFLVSSYAKHIRRSFDRISANAFLLMILLFFKPYALTNLSLQLSFAAGFLLAFAEIRKGTGRHKPGRIIRILRTSAVLQLGLLPLQLQSFYTFAPCGILFNLLLLCAIELVFVFCFCAVTVSFLFLPAGFFFAGPVYYAANFFETALDAFNRIRFSSIPLGHQNPVKIILYWAVFGLILWIDRRSAQKVWLFLLPMWLLFLPNHYGFVRVVNLSVGQGDCSVIMSGRNVIVIDCGSLSKKEIGEKIIKPLLQYYGYNEADYLFLSHTDEDHINGIRNCSDVFGNLKGVFVDRNYPDSAGLLMPAVNSEIIYTDPGDSVRIGNIRIRFLISEGEISEEPNDRCQMLDVTAEGFHLLYFGDVSAGVLRGLKDVPKSPYLVKVPHHGSIYSLDEAFYKELKPGVSVVSVGRNNYGHPSEEVLSVLNQYGSRCYVTMKNGAVITLIKRGKAYTYSVCEAN